MTARFQTSRIGRAGSVYVCHACGRRTRETGHDESALELCAFCMLEAENDNALSDGHIDDAEHAATLATLKARYNR